jgi:teichuronic acid biosynthesis glycosyltransferase TuaC
MSSDAGIDPTPGRLAIEPAGRRPAEAPGRLRVLAVIPHADNSAFVFARRQVASLQQLGLEVEIFFLSGRQSIAALFGEWARFRRALDGFQPDVVHAHFGTMTAFFCAIATRLPLVITYRGSDLNPVPSISRWRSHSGRVLSQLAALRAARIVCVSEALRDRLWWRRNRTAVIPTGVDLSRFVPRPKDEARRELGWSPSERVVLFSAGPHPKIKRLDLAEEAVAWATAAHGPIRFVVAHGTLPPESMPTFMNAADCLLVTSDYEGSPNIVKEAMACNLPVVSVDVGDIRERLEGVEPSDIADRDPLQLGRALVGVLADGRRSNGRSVAQRLDSTAIGRRLIAELEAARRPADQPARAARVLEDV